MTSQKVRTIMNGSSFDSAAAASSGDSNTFGPRQTTNDWQAFESLLVIVFAALSRLSPNSAERTRIAFDELTQILRQYVARVLTKWGIADPRMSADDVVQELYVRLLSRNLVGRYDQTRSLRRTFLFGVLRKVMSDVHRRIKPRRTVPLPVDLLDPTPYPDEALAMHEIRGLVSSAIGRLRPQLADAIRAQYRIDGHSAEQLGLTPSALHTRTSRARQALREDLKDRLNL